VPRPRPAPSTRRSRVQRAARRGQRAAKDAAFCLLTAAFRSRCAGTAPPALAHRRHAYPCPGPTSHRDGRTCFTVTTRFTIS
jgi:hypothetical protein